MSELQKELEYQKKRREDAIRRRKFHEERKMSFGFSLKELHDFPTPLQRAKFNKELVKIMRNLNKKEVR